MAQTLWDTCMPCGWTLMPFLAMPWPAAPGPQSVVYTNNDTNTTYTLNTRLSNFTVAQAACNALGGHLASYNTQQEQLEVENFFVSKGLLFPTCHGSYWIGLAAESWPAFEWLDPVAGNLTGPESYTNWGLYLPPTLPREPNQLLGDENCAVANYTEAASGAWGWADTTCESEFVSICKIPRGWQSSGEGLWLLNCDEGSAGDGHISPQHSPCAKKLL